MPKVSVLMPVYNTKEEYLKEAIESILNQTFADFELIICDDGSTDDSTLNILSNFLQNDKRITVIYGEHKGIGATRNKLLRTAQGELCALMDSDDISFPERLEKQVNFLELNKEISMCGTWFECFPKLEVCKCKQILTYYDFLRCMSVGNPTIMFRKSIIDKYDLYYNENLSTSEDYDFCSRAIKYIKIVNIPEVLLKYRVLPSSNSHENREKLQKNDKYIKQNMLDFLTDDKGLQQRVMASICTPPIVSAHQKMKYTFLQRIFSLKNQKINGKKKKVLMILGMRIKL